MDSVLRPRDIQARIRSGESPETVAEAARTTVDKIMGFATPVLAERAYVAEQALKASVRRRAGDGPVGHLGDAVEQRLATRDVAADQVSWDAWRREDGRWTLVADYPTAGLATRAHFVYDQAGRYVVAEDDEARWLVGERAATTEAAPTTPVTSPPSEHVTVTDETVVETVFEPAAEPDRAAAPGPATGSAAGEQLPLGDEAIELVTGVRPVPESEQLPADDWMLTQASERTAPPPVQPPARSAAQPPEQPPAPRVADEPAETLFDAPVPEEPSPASDEVVETEQEAESRPAERPATRKSSKSKRASVPSWDEIMFGSGKGE